MGNILASEFLKLRRKMVWFLVVIGPTGVIALQALNYGLRFDFLMKQYASDPWGYLMINVSNLLVPALLMGMTIISSMIASLEHQTNAWKQTVALPVGRTRLYLGKFGVTALLLLGSTTLAMVGTILLGLLLGHELEALPWKSLLIAMYGSFLSALPYLAVQVWLSVAISNQAVPLTIGIAGLVVSIFVLNGPSSLDWLPWKWPFLVRAEPMYSMVAGLLTGAVFYLLGTIHFVRKDVG
ncbi:ABC transporter permease [Paenibacillus sp. GCM10012307]|uniref:ABC transporter permease n=1 Tax=Paenibacillus roseus TaxID=2798579 RepID=A0A934J3B3_9BACL|nr:ABC transporter permease [Paenibacillus roseus]MBJ6363977.1 ABC transporter permease [Paenibacillus roseus]